MNNTQSRVAGKTAIVTGGRGDLGSATAALLAEHGAKVASLDVAGIPAAAAHKNISEYDVDVTSEEASPTPSAGSPRTSAPRTSWSTPPESSARPEPPTPPPCTDFDTIFNVNVKGVWLMTKHVVPGMIEKGAGSIINFSSIHGLTGGRNVPLYHATKGAVRLLSKSDAAAYGAHGIRVNSIHPGSMNTRMSRRSAEQSGHRPRGLLQAAGGLQPAAPPGRTGRDRLRRALPGLGRVPLHHRLRTGDRRRLHRRLSHTAPAGRRTAAAPRPHLNSFERQHP